SFSALDGYSDVTIGHATHYHTDWVHPYWSRSLDKVAIVGTHLFFQAFAGRPGNFSASHAGREPRIAALMSFSAAHRASENSADLEVPQRGAVEREDSRTAMPALAMARPAQERLPDRSALPDAGILLVTLDVSAGPESFRQLGERHCAGRDECKLIGWTGR